MKKFKLIALMLILYIGLTAQIGDVIRTETGYTRVFDGMGNLLASGYTGTRQCQWDFSSTFILTRTPQGLVKTYDQNLTLLAVAMIPGPGQVQAVGNQVLYRERETRKLYTKALQLKSLSYDIH